MSVEQTYTIIDHARHFHELLSEYYHRMEETAHKSRVRLLLNYMCHHEDRLAAALEDYEHEAPLKVLNTWLQSAQDDDAIAATCRELKDLQINPDMDVDEVIGLGIQLSDCLISAYRDLASRAEPESVRQVFESLLQMEEKAQQQFARDSGRLSDL